MNLKLFISYSHADDKELDRLVKHLAMLQRDGTISTWTDKEIGAGGRLNESISDALSECDIFLALVSPDYLNSSYCYDREFGHAQTRADEGSLVIIPVIVEPCDWLSSPFSKYKALPKDGRPISDFTNQNNAMLDVIQGIRGASQTIVTTKSALPSSIAPLKVPRIQQDFDVIDKSEFADQSYKNIAQYFETSCSELNSVGNGTLKAKFETMTPTSFTCTVVNRNKVRNADAHITVSNAKGRGSGGGISYIYERYAQGNSSHGSINVEADDHNLYLVLNNYTSNKNNKYSAQQVAEVLWLQFVKQAGIDYD